MILLRVVSQIVIVWCAIVSIGGTIQYWFIRDMNEHVPTPIAFASAMVSAGLIAGVAVALSLWLWSNSFLWP